MKLNVKKTVKANSKKANVKTTAKTAKAVKAKAVVAKLVGERIALVSGAKGQVFRKGNLFSDGSFKLTQNNIGIKYDGALVSAESKKWDKQTRLELGNYVCARGERAAIKYLTLDEARKLASKNVKFKRNGRDVSAKYCGKIEQQYIATIEKLKNGEHFFQLETEKLDSNAKHFGQILRA